jgi:hypothetical protein
LNSPSKERGLEERAEELAKVVAIMGIKPKDKVIEFGPGTGTMAILLARRGCFVYVYEHPSSISLEELKKNAQRFKEEIKEAGGELKIIEGDITDPRIQHTITANGHYEHWVCVDVLRPWGQQAQGLRPAPKDGIVDPGVVAQIISLMGPLVGKSIYISHPDSAWDGIYYDFPPSLITVFNSTQAFAYVQAVSHSSKSGLLLLLGRHTLSETTRPLKEEELLLGQI